ncbi:MAG: hypothetical protein JSS81_13465 [Acidobacteria bacterium]|nr:hypothetical protein [Acidobacteriota bacterium]
MIGMLLRLLIRGTRDAVQEHAAKRDLEQKLGRSVSKDEVYSLGAQLDAAQSSGPPPNLISTPREASVPFGDAKPPMKLTTKLLLIGVPLFLIAAAVGGFILFNMPQRTFNRLNPFGPKPPAGTFPAQIGDFTLDHKPDFDEPSSYNPAPSFESEYKKGYESIRLKIWSFTNDADLNAAFDKRRQSLKPTDKGIVSDDSPGRYAIASLPGWSSYVLFKDGNYLKQVDAYSQKNALDFEGWLRNAPPREQVALNEADLKKKANNNASSELTVTQLLDDYKKDAAAADKKYKDKTVRISGTAVVSDRDKSGKWMLAFMRPGSTKPAEGMIVASFEKDKESNVTSVKKGDVVTIQCRVSMNLVFSVMLESCSKP